MSKILTVTDERVLEAAAKCPTAEHTLRTLFPEAFRSEIINIPSSQKILDSKGYDLVVTRHSGNLMNQSLYLSKNFNWEFKFDSEHTLVLVPVRK